ncbi:MAG TPA: hypothetical protein VFO75_02485 [Candidatus Dormibacteraeota bacterium]|nr:hypothetical protein [Candidatus Dormibacteraeota bacterium]
MRRLFVKPLTWMVLAEVVVLAALVGVAWHMVAGVARSPVAPLMLPSSTAPPDDTSAPNVSPDLINPPDASTPLLPGLNVDPAFWRVRLAALNGAEAQLEALEWRIVHSAMDTVRRYVDSVVVPAVERAEGRSG